MPLIDPETRSPGHLFLRYTHVGKPRSLSMRLTNTVDLVDISALAVEANSLAGYFAACMPTTVSFTSWGLKDNDGLETYEASLSDPPSGALSVLVGLDDYYSTTLSLVGRGGATSIGYASGRALTRFHVGGTIQPTQGMKNVNTAVEMYYAGLQLALNDSTRFFADFYGQKADVVSLMPFQFNAAIQRKDGT